MTMKLVSTVTIGADSPSSIEFSGIPQDGDDLLLILSGRTTAAGSADCYVKLNGATTSSHVRLQGTGSAASFATVNPLFRLPATTYTASTFGNTSIYVPDYKSSVDKMVSVDSTVENNATAADFFGFMSAKQTSTSAVTSIGVGYSATFAQYSVASLYTITKGSGGATVA